MPAPPAPGLGPAALYLPAFKLWLPLLVVPAVLAGFEYRRVLGPAWRRAYAAFLAATIVGFGGMFALRAWKEVRTPPEWDVQAFWIVGKTAAEGGNPYSPAEVRAVHRAHSAREPLLTQSPVFAREVLDVGMHYPPPTLLLLAPLGAFDLRTGALVWYAAHAVVFAAAVVLLWRTFLRDAGLLGLAVTAALVLALRTSYTVVAMGQTSMLVLLCLLLYWRHRDRTVGGVYAALGVVVKPVFAVLVAWAALARRPRSVAATALTGAALTLAAVAGFGPRATLGFFTDNASGRAPAWMYTEHINQSLVAAVSRALALDPGRGSPLLHPAFLVPALLATAVTLWLVARLGRERGDLALALLVPLALLVYPQTLDHYTVLLLVPMFFMWTRGAALGVSPVAAMAVIAAVFALIRVDVGDLTLAAVALQWAVLVALAARALAARPVAAGVPAAPLAAR